MQTYTDNEVTKNDTTIKSPTNFHLTVNTSTSVNSNQSKGFPVAGLIAGVASFAFLFIILLICLCRRKKTKK